MRVDDVDAFCAGLYYAVRGPVMRRERPTRQQPSAVNTQTTCPIASHNADTDSAGASIPAAMAPSIVCRND